LLDELDVGDLLVIGKSVSLIMESDGERYGGRVFNVVGEVGCVGGNVIVKVNNYSARLLSKFDGIAVHCALRQDRNQDARYVGYIDICHLLSLGQHKLQVVKLGREASHIV
jgi:hypothetical protein